MRVIIENNYQDISKWVSLYIKDKINNAKYTPFVLGLPTGSTPLQVYKNLIEYYKNGELSFKNVITFNMDEYVGLSPDNRQSYHYFMVNNFFNHIDIPKENINLLNGMAEDIELECDKYEKNIQKHGIDLFLCGIGSDGHIAFNEPGSSFSSTTRIKTLSEETIIDNYRFFNTIEEVPTQALTVGIKTIMSAKEIIIMASGIKKAKAIRECIEGCISNQWTCTMSQHHPKCIVICDKKATMELKMKTYKYYKNLQKVIDLHGKLIENPIKKYIKPTDKILITSPHPDDDVIGMGGTMQLLPIKNCKVCYCTNGLGGLKEKDNLGKSTRIKEAISSIKVLGYEPEQVIDAKLPFYFTENREITDLDIDTMNNIIDTIKPNHIFICIDEDPKKTHIKCLDILKKCYFDKYVKYLWLYKSAWGNWTPEDSFNTKVYIPKNKFEKKLLSIDMHFSQFDPLVTKNKSIKSFKDIVKKQNKSELYIGHFRECFKRIDPTTLENI